MGRPPGTSKRGRSIRANPVRRLPDPSGGGLVTGRSRRRGREATDRRSLPTHAPVPVGGGSVGRPSPLDSRVVATGRRSRPGRIPARAAPANPWSTHEALARVPGAASESSRREAPAPERKRRFPRPRSGVRSRASSEPLPFPERCGASRPGSAPRLRSPLRSPLLSSPGRADKAPPRSGPSPGEGSPARRPPQLRAAVRRSSRPARLHFVFGSLAPCPVFPGSSP